MTRRLWSRLADLWCTLMHPAPMWPSHGHYRCPRCLRQHAVPWEPTARITASQPTHARLHPETAPSMAQRIARPAHSW